MLHLLHLPRDLNARLDRLRQQTGLSKAELLGRLVSRATSTLEDELRLEGASPSRRDRPMDQRLRESGLGA